MGTRQNRSEAVPTTTYIKVGCKGVSALHGHVSMIGIFHGVNFKNCNRAHTKPKYRNCIAFALGFFLCVFCVFFF